MSTDFQNPRASARGAVNCIRIQNGIMCVHDSFVSLEPYGAKVWCEYHSYTGPAFFRSERAIKEIEHPSKKTWDAYYKWCERKAPSFTAGRMSKVA